MKYSEHYSLTKKKQQGKEKIFSSEQRWDSTKLRWVQQKFLKPLGYLLDVVHSDYIFKNVLLYDAIQVCKKVEVNLSF